MDKRNDSKSIRVISTTLTTTHKKSHLKVKYLIDGER